MLILSTPTTACAQLAEGPVTARVRGYLELRQALVFGLDPDLEAFTPLLPAGYHPAETYGAQTRVRPTLELRAGEGATAVLTPQAFTGHAFYATEPEGIEDLVTVERAYLFAATGDVDLTLGKQVTTWGSGLLLSPTDPFFDKNPADLQAERPGVWAVRAGVPLSELSGLDLFVGTPESPCCDALAVARAETSLDTTDLALQGGWDARDDLALVGLDLKGEWALGLWLESGAQVPQARPEDTAVEVEVGADYSFEVLGTLYVAAEYVYRSAGETDVGAMLSKDALRDALSTGASPASLLQGAARGRRLFMGRHSAVLLTRAELDTRWRVSLSGVVNALDGTGTASPQVQWTPADAWTLTLGGQFAFGPDGGEYTLRLPTLTPAEAALAAAVDPELGPALARVDGARLQPSATVYLWGRHAF